MTTNDVFGRTVTAWLHDDAEHHVPHHLEEILQRTATTRQRPAWSSLERWLPVDTTFSARVTRPFQPLGPLVVAALLILALVAAIIVAGSRQSRPAPYGPASNGVVARAEAGDIYLVNPVSKRETTLVSGPEWDSNPRFSNDGMKVAFLRRTSEASVKAALMVANADGSDLRPVTEPLLDVSDGDWSGDGSVIALVSMIGDVRSLTVVDVQRGTSRVLDVGMTVDSVGWLPPDGREIVFRGVSQLFSAVLAVQPDGKGLRSLTPRDGVPESGYLEPVVSPDGRLLAFNSWDDNIHQVMHVRNLSDGSSWVIPAAEPFDDRMTAEFSPNGQQLLHLRSLRDGPPPTFDGILQLVLAPADGSGSGTPLGPEIPYSANVPELGYTYSPDGSYVLLQKTGEHKLWTLPVDGGPGRVEPWSGGELPEIQRVVP
jgi:hypothetical protein